MFKQIVFVGDIFYEGTDDNWYLWASPREAAWFAEQEWAKRRREKKAKMYVFYFTYIIDLSKCR